MKIEQYRKEVTRTMAQLGDPIHDSMHMVIGMMTECTELLQAFKTPEIDIVNIKEEVGDLMWYVANYANIHKLQLMNHFIDFALYNSNYKNPKDVLEDIIIIVGELQDLDKKLFAYKKPYDLTKQFGLFVHLGTLIYVLVDKLNLCNSNNLYTLDCFEQILETNINKLKQRYPEKFNEKDAVNRNLNAEREILEK